MAAGGTFLGLATLLTDARGFDEVLDLCATGHSQKVDMLVSDIYAADYEKIGLKGSVIASSFGKARRSQARDDIKQVLYHALWPSCCGWWKCSGGGAVLGKG
jgi:type II pantothenate kinase